MLVFIASKEYNLRLEKVQKTLYGVSMMMVAKQIVGPKSIVNVRNCYSSI